MTKFKHNNMFRRAALTLLALIMTCTTMQAQFGGGSGTQYDPYLINNETHWNNFCYALQDNDTWNRFSGKCVKLGANITVTRMAGSSGHDFMGIFVGDGHTLTVSYGSSVPPLTEDYAAPFRNLQEGAYILNLHVDGHIYTSNKYASGIAGNQYGNVTISNCRSSVIIHSSKQGDGTHGGIVATQNNSLTLSGCIYDGRMLTTNGTTHCGVLVGYRGGGTCTISDCLYAPAAVTLATGESYITNGSTFCRNYSGTPANCYYTKPLGTAQGKVAYTRTNLPANIGTQGTNHGMMQAYSNGLKYNNTYYVGSDNNLIVDNEGTTDPDGWTDYPPDPEVPVGGGTLLLIGFGAAYSMKKRKKED